MSRIKSTGTQLEIILRKYLHKSGFRYRVRYNLKGRPDLIFPKQKVAVFIHGCFWHMHGCNNSVIPKTNTEFWVRKLKSNTIRDRLVKKELKNAGWNVRTVWECQIEANSERAAMRLVRYLQKHGVTPKMQRKSSAQSQKP